MITYERGTIGERITISMALASLVAVVLAWLAGEGDLFGLLWAWYEVVSGRVKIGEIVITYEWPQV